MFFTSPAGWVSHLYVGLYSLIRRPVCDEEFHSLELDLAGSGTNVLGPHGAHSKNLTKIDKKKTNISVLLSHRHRESVRRRFGHVAPIQPNDGLESRGRAGRCGTGRGRASRVVETEVLDAALVFTPWIASTKPTR